jgi:2-dehydropantoate 2-reductase
MAYDTPAQPALSWCVVGNGAIGLLAASRLKLAGYTPSLWLRQPTKINVTFGQHSLQFCPATSALNAVLVPVKSYAVQTAIDSLLPVLTADAQVVLSHNGMGTIEQILPLLAPHQGLWFLTTTHGALKQGSNITHSGLGQSVLAPLNNAAYPHREAVSQAMDAALGPLTITDDIQPFLWQKLAINAVINPLTALHNCRNGVLSHAHFAPTIAAILHEVCQLAGYAGITLDFDITLSRVQQVITSTAENFSSMQQDISHQRRTEIDAITGFIVHQAARYQLAVPQNTSLLLQVQQLEQHYGR